MSSTGRNSEERDEYDFYPTPEWCVTRFLEKIQLPFDYKWLEPCAGDGAVVRAVDKFYSGRIDWTLIEIQERFAETLRQQKPDANIIIGSYQDIDSPAQVIITNPPFNKAFDFIQKAILGTEPRPNYVCMLLRLNFLGSKERAEFMQEYTPDLYVLPNRPSFKGKGTDSIEYAWFVWSLENGYGKLKQVRHPKVVMLNQTSKAERVQQKKLRG